MFVSYDMWEVQRFFFLPMGNITENDACRKKENSQFLPLTIFTFLFGEKIFKEIIGKKMGKFFASIHISVAIIS